MDSSRRPTGGPTQGENPEADDLLTAVKALAEQAHDAEQRAAVLELREQPPRAPTASEARAQRKRELARSRRESFSTTRYPEW